MIPATPALAIGGTLVCLFVALALASLLLHGKVYDQDLLHRLQPPVYSAGGDSAHLLGTDSLGRDVLARIMAGTRISLEIAVVAVILGGVAGIALGMIAGYFGGWIDDLLMRFTDAVLAIPLVLFALSVIAVIGGGVRNLILVIAFTQWMTYARTARGETLVLRESLFVTAARSIGCGNLRILARHVLPHLLPSAIVLATLNVSTAVLLEAGLSFLGLGIAPPDPSLGSMLTEGRQYITRAPWLAIWPGLTLLLLVLAINLTGDGLRTRLDRR
jgi:peptide/nickel transport system permease protein